MRAFFFHLQLSDRRERDGEGVRFASLEAAYLDVCRTIPEVAADLIREGHDIGACTYIIADADDRVLLEVPFDELKRPARLPLAALQPEAAAASASAPVCTMQVARMRTMAETSWTMVADSRIALARSRALLAGQP